MYSYTIIRYMILQQLSFIKSLESTEVEHLSRESKETLVVNKLLLVLTTNWYKVKLLCFMLVTIIKVKVTILLDMLSGWQFATYDDNLVNALIWFAKGTKLSTYSSNVVINIHSVLRYLPISVCKTLLSVCTILFSVSYMHTTDAKWYGAYIQTRLLSCIQSTALKSIFYHLQLQTKRKRNPLNVPLTISLQAQCKSNYVMMRCVRMHFKRLLKRIHQCTFWIYL